MAGLRAGMHLGANLETKIRSAGLAPVPLSLSMRLQVPMQGADAAGDRLFLKNQVFMSISIQAELSALVQAMTSTVAPDSAQNVLGAAQWELLAPYLVPVNLAASEVLFAEGAPDRNLYMVESGSLSVHYQDAKERIRLALVGPGSMLGEGAFFAHRPRRATVQAVAASRLWCLTALRFTELSNRQPALALALVTMAGQVLARRSVDSRRRVAST